jgi:hypothetical protein
MSVPLSSFPWKSRWIYKLSIFSFSCLRRSVLIEHIANAWGDLLVLLIVFCKIDKLTLYRNGFCEESMSVPFSSFPWIMASPESGQRIVYFN